MSITRRATITIEVDADLLDELRASVGDDRQVGGLIESMLKDLADSRRSNLRSHVMEAYEKSLKQYGALYERLAK